MHLYLCSCSTLKLSHAQSLARSSVVFSPKVVFSLKVVFSPKLMTSPEHVTSPKVVFSSKPVFSPKVVFSLGAGAPHTEQAVMGSVCQQPGCNEGALAPGA
jgi:hypothetical protein